MCNEMVVQVIRFLRHFSEELSRLAARKYARIIQKLGFNVCLVCCLFFCCLFVFLFVCLGNELSSLHLCYLLPNPLMKDYSWNGISHALGMATITVLLSPAIGPFP